MIPPLLLDGLRRSPLRRYGWFGNYSSWEEALRHCTGYDKADILERVLTAARQVASGEKVFERDGVLFNAIEYDWPVLTGLMWAAASNDGQLRVLDYGGSLGRSYFQNRKFLRGIQQMRWGIVEQEHFVQAGRRYLQTDQLLFFDSLDQCLQAVRPNTALLSSVLSYLQNPFDILDQISHWKISHIIIDRLPLIEGLTDRLTVQKVNPRIYPASYPAWFFSREKFLNFVRSRFELVEETDCGIQFNIPCNVSCLFLAQSVKN
jgi:putative methyltransferase (TIGR04325 family)